MTAHELGDRVAWWVIVLLVVIEFAMYFGSKWLTARDPRTARIAEMRAALEEAKREKRSRHSAV